MTLASAITALLGPTNTGKTHRAIERMLEHESGMIGLPLRLLAREVYDRLTIQLGEAKVALVTGEEKRVPRRPSYWVCTVEAMPVSREVDFLAIDEIQLAAHHERGHVFTERLLTARGRRETWLLGADTMRPLVAELVPTARVVSHPRLSRLTFAGAAKLARLPPRSAVVAFSMQDVYAAAERIRAKKGGAAVVLGALSPRTRNAQVAMFQSGEVDYLVATDAIGMGLNLDVGHVAFASLRKFDGREGRDLEAAEIAQIAGRAGRHLANGTFGTLLPVTMPDGLSAKVEAHKFPAVRRVVWRNADLDFASIEALLASLAAKPRRRCLERVEGALDAAALQRLAMDPAVRTRARGPEALGLLWDVCRIPDFKKVLVEGHVGLLADVFAALSGPRGALDPDWMVKRVGELDRTEGDIDTLVERIASIRTFTYIANHDRWVGDAPSWQARTRAVEDRLSDALHERLVQRFVERSSAVRRPSPKPGVGRKDHASPPPAPSSHPFAALAAMRPAGREEPPARGDDAWVERIVSAPHAAFDVDAAGRVRLAASEGGEADGLGRLVRGASLLLPDVRLGRFDELGPGARSRIERRLLAFGRDLVEELLAPLRGPEVRRLSAAGRGVIYQLEQGLGTALVAQAQSQLAELSAGDAEMLSRMGVAVGACVVHVPDLLRPTAIIRRVALVEAYFGDEPRVAPRPGAVSMAAGRVEPRAWTAVGYPAIGPRAIRADVLERVHAELASEGAAAASVARIATWLGASHRDAERIASALGFEREGAGEASEAPASSPDA